MPKVKTNRGASKRFRRTATGKFKRNHSGVRHLLTAKSPKRRRKLRHSALVSESDHARVRRLLPNG